MYLLIGIPIALALVIYAVMLGESVSLLAQFLVAFAGALVLLGAMLLTVFKKYFYRSTATLAFVRTGLGPAKVVSSVGSFAFPILHRIFPVTLEPVALSIDLRGEEALTAKDGSPVNVAAEMTVRVERDPEDILLAARSCGERGVNQSLLAEFFLEQFRDALQTVAATKTAAEICRDSQPFAQAVQDIMGERVAEDGLNLERIEVRPY
jgi:uncharacterized membrane protein YqiK